LEDGVPGEEVIAPDIAHSNEADMKRSALWVVALAVGGLLGWLVASGRLADALAQEKQPQVSPAAGSVLPVPPAPFQGTINLRAKDSKSDFPQR
jgi:hypothetical protein